MTERIQLTPALPGAYKLLVSLNAEVGKALAGAGLDPKLGELIKIRASQLNGCAYCTDQHSRDARKLGEDERRLYLLPAWRETELYSEQERAALALTEAITRLSETRDVPDEVYREATKVFTDAQYTAVAWAATLINTWTRLGVTSRKPLPRKVAA